ncbi:DUF2063 domain-containing protein [Rhizobium sp. SSA_523]|uniref:HvfC/BufC N-terminal domain-containing protein n=1 Tax=Rhizobium sp. SSA_523 TaxID=2952477 RepID=UPI0020917B6B|nr:putative DNA-binding domain-containing protein [Rhizobium sp. SSA_523]MCO5733019.1 putative DNA-binding domain-containing protein [Rhizobium sp. SSA_523]WKC23900.1 DNA-binding domain-containing protein [Rhizobium sp. SSA_523]
MTMDLAERQRAFALALCNPGHTVPDGVTTSRGVPDDLRFAVYRNNVHVSLTTALAQRFPVTHRLVGDAFFTGMARVYAADHKPSSPLIMEYGDDFPDFVAAFPPAASLDYLPDLARIEVAWTRAYHAADRRPLAPASLLRIADADLASLSLIPHPSAGLVFSRFPAGSIWSAHQEPVLRAVSHRSAETVLVVRPALQVLVHVLPPQDAGFAADLLAGLPLGEAAGKALDENREFDFGAALVGLVGLGAFCSFHPLEGEG